MLFFLISFAFSSITFNEESKVFTLNTEKSSYQILVDPLNYLVHLYYGARLNDEVKYLNHLFLRDFDGLPYEIGYTTMQYSLDQILQEYPTYGTGDFRIPAFSAYNKNGTSSVVLTYKNHSILTNAIKPEIPGLPHSTSEKADILDIELEDSFMQLTVHLHYSVFEEKDVITRYASFTNTDKDNIITVTRAMSMNLDFHESKYDLITFYGGNLAERYIDRKSLVRGRITIDSIRGASSHEQNPSCILASKNADENTGETYGVSLVYSGNFAIEAEVDQSEHTRLLIGINPNQFRYLINPNDTFYTPEAILVYSPNGFGELSRKMHHFIYDNIMQSKWKNRQRPILVNSWEAAYFSFDDEKLLDMAKDASDLGIEMFVLDDGWFGHRDNDNSSLGDWYVDPRKIKIGMGNLTKQINQMGLAFGLWFEPEMISEDSDLYRSHPEYAMRIPGRNPILSRRQLVLDFTNDEVVDNLYNQMTNIHDNANITYVKWDMNRHITDLYSLNLPHEQQGEIFHRYILNVYKLLNRITSRYPDMLLETCSGGGGRFDLGMLYYSPQIWTSDDTDPIERLKIQFGTSFMYPMSSMGAHVSVSPNEQTGRKTPLNTRAIVAMSGTFGYELDTRKLEDEDRQAIKQHIKDYHEYHDLIANGELYRIMSPFDNHYFCIWMFVNNDKTKALLNVVKIMTRVDVSYVKVKLSGLDPEKKYQIDELYQDQAFTGMVLMNAGIIIPTSREDYTATRYVINEVN